MVSTGTDASRLAESNHEAPHRCSCEAFMVRQAHHEGYWSVDSNSPR